MKTVLELKKVTKTVGKSVLLSDISLKIGKGEAFGFLGPNGAGKTTTMKCILGIMEPTSGHISILGGDIHDTEIRRRIGFMPENTYLYKYLTGDEFLDFNGAFYGLSGESFRQRKDTVLEAVGLAHARNKRLHTYSKGMLQRIGLAQAILHEPELIFLDEPMSGLDPIGRKLVKDLILDLKGQWVTIFFNTHILSDVASICDQFAIICQGEIAKNMKMTELTTDLETLFMDTVTHHQGAHAIII